jgi:hypothetical protein
MVESGSERSGAETASPFLLILNAWWQRLLDSVTAEESVFVVNGERIATSVWEAVVISERIYAMFRSTAQTYTFCTDDDKISATVFRRFLGFLRSRTLSGFTHEDARAFISICRLLGNDELIFLLLGCLSRRLGDQSSSDRKDQTTGGAQSAVR